MIAQALEQQTYLPEQPQQVAEMLSFLEAHEAANGARPTPRYLLVGADEQDSVEITEGVYSHRGAANADADNTAGSRPAGRQSPYCCQTNRRRQACS